MLHEERDQEETSDLTARRARTCLMEEEFVCECVYARELRSACLQSAFFSDKPSWKLIRKLK